MNLLICPIKISVHMFLLMLVGPSRESRAVRLDGGMPFKNLL